jgi:tRNA pseudouridine65 synthase
MARARTPLIPQLPNHNAVDNDTPFACADSRNGKCTAVLCQPLTGRTHQIRRHAREIGHPLIGDSQHGNSRVNRYWRQQRRLDRLALHCWTLAFDLEGKSYECMAPVPRELRKSLETFVTSVWDEAVRLEPGL